MTEGDRNLQV